MKDNRSFAIIISTILLVILTIIFLSYTVYDKVENSLTDISAYKTSLILDAAAQQISNDFLDAQLLQESIHSNPEVKLLLLGKFNSNQLDKATQSLISLLSLSRIAQTHFTSIAIFSSDNKMRLHVNSRGENLPLLNNPLYNHQAPHEDADSHSQLTLHRNDNTHDIFLTFPIYDDRKLIGSCEMYIDLPKVSSILNQYAKQISSNAIIVVSNGKEQIFTISNYTISSESMAENIGTFESLLHTTKPIENKILTSTYLPQLDIYVGLYQTVESLAQVSTVIKRDVITIIVVITFFSCLIIYAILKLVLYRNVRDEKRLSQAVELMQLPMWEYLAPGILKMNNHSLALLGKHDAVQKNLDMDGIISLIHPDDMKDGLFSHTDNTEIQKQIPFDKILRFAHADGHWHWLHLKGHISGVTSNKSIQYATGIFIDIHEWYNKIEQDKIYQQSLEKQVEDHYAIAQKNDDSIMYEKSLLYNVINYIPDYIYFKDSEGRLLGANKAFLDLLNTNLSQIRGKYTSDIKLPFTFTEATAGFLRNHQDCFENPDQVLRDKAEICYPDGRTTPLEIFKVAFKDHLDNAVGIVCIVRDISEHIIIEDALRHAKEAATAANTAKSDFLANMSHEIRTPLNGILGLNHLALQQDCSKEVRAYLEKIDISAKTLLKIVNDILDFSKIEAGRIDLEHIPFRLARSIQFAIDMLQVQANEKNIYLKYIIEGTIPEYILGDPLRFRQTLLNLLNNAVKFTSVGGVTLTIIVEQKITQKANITIKIQDTGIGMTKNQMARIFQPFMQADSSTTRRYGGTGLGLPITRSLIEAMGAKLHVESEENVGTTFSFTIAANIPTEIKSEIDSEVDNKDSLNRIKGKKILLVEDNEINQLIAIEVLESFGVNVSVACDGQQGVDMALYGDFDLILMDIQMPVMDGLTAAKTLRYNNYDKPIIAMTANAMPEDKIRARDAGMQEHIGKPFDIQILQNCLIQWLDDNNKI